MRLETIRRGRVPLGLALLLVSIWLGTGIRRAGDVDHSVVLDSPLGLLEPHKVEPGWQFVPYGLLRLSSYPTAIATYEFTVGAGDFPLVSREGIPLVVDGAAMSMRWREDPPETETTFLARTLQPPSREANMVLTVRSR